MITALNYTDTPTNCFTAGPESCRPQSMTPDTQIGTLPETRKFSGKPMISVADVPGIVQRLGARPQESCRLASGAGLFYLSSSGWCPWQPISAIKVKGKKHCINILFISKKSLYFR